MQQIFTSLPCEGQNAESGAISVTSRVCVLLFSLSVLACCGCISPGRIGHDASDESDFPPMPLSLPDRAKLLSEDRYFFMERILSWIYFDRSRLPMLPPGVRVQIHDIEAGKEESLFTLDQITFPFKERKVSIANPLRGWLSGWWSGDTYYRSYQVENDKGFYLLVDTEQWKSNNWPRDWLPPSRPLDLPRGSSLLLERRAREWDGWLSKMWFYLCRERPVPSQEETDVVLRDLHGDDLKSALQSFGVYNFWIKHPRRAWEYTWRKERKPNKWEYYTALIVEAERGFYLRADWTVHPGLRTGAPAIIE